MTRDGKIMFYRDDCHRDKSPGKHPTWVSARLKAWSVYNGELNVKRCLFGLHQLPLAYVRHKPVAVVESEKTALLMSIAYGNHSGQVWMACGGLGNINRWTHTFDVAMPKRCVRVVDGRIVVAPKGISVSFR